MNIMECISTRRNIKSFKSDPIARETVVELLRLASFAPNHRMTEPWEIYFLGPETREKLAHKTNFGGAPIVLAIACTPAKTQIDRDEHYAAVACFIQNLMLAAWEKGIGTGWSSIAASERARQIIGIPEGYEVVGVIPMGIPAELPQLKERQPIENKLHERP
jgi:nitroreductase